jgi:hypothetical protein
MPGGRRVRDRIGAAADLPFFRPGRDSAFDAGLEAVRVGMARAGSGEGGHFHRPPTGGGRGGHAAKQHRHHRRPPGRVGSSSSQDVPGDCRGAKLAETLGEQMAKGAKLDGMIRTNMIRTKPASLGYDI